VAERGSGRVALVTGGSRGIGLGIARCLARDGFALAINGVRTEGDAGDSLETVRGEGVEVIYCRGDISSPADRRSILDRIRDRFGRLDVLVNNAGVAPRTRQHVLEATEESFEYVVRTNLQGPYFLTQAAARWMIEQREADPHFSGCIVNVGSISATVASVNRGEYCVSKAGVAMATRLWAVALGEHGIPVYEVQPGVIDTDMTSGVKEKYDRLIEGGLTVQNRWGTAEDVGRVVAAMARGDMPYSTGQVVMVDGGLTLPRL
jgi:3-oxoacyl-[acyl-carrier protein] reductase